jgi:hypothetical protein
VALVVVAAFVITLVLGIGRQRQTSRTWAARSARGTPAWRTQSRTMIGAVVIWTVLVAATVGWDLVSFIFQSHSLPTLSFFIGEVTRYRIGRGLCFAVWLGIGGYLVAGWRTEARQ